MKNLTGKGIVKSESVGGKTPARRRAQKFSLQEKQTLRSSRGKKGQR